MHNFNAAMKKVGKLLHKMVAFVLEITEPDCHLLENKYFFNYALKKKKSETAIIYCQKLILLAIILNSA